MMKRWREFWQRFGQPRRLWVSVSLVAGALIIGSILIALTYWTWIAAEISLQLDRLRGTRASQIFASFPQWEIGGQFRQTGLDSVLQELGYHSGPTEGALCSRCFRWEGDLHLLIQRPEYQVPGTHLAPGEFRVEFERDGGLARIVRISEKHVGTVPSLEHPPKRIGTFSAGRLRTQDFVSLANLPVTLRLAVMGIEDAGFLEHRGISVKAILRALFQDIKALRFVQGGSTITQQLMKNLFFSHEKIVSRKIKEAFYALVAEAHHSKEEILEAYLNEVYLGQAGGHEIHGVNEAARFYFDCPATELTLDQSATIAALIQAPNLRDPRRHPKRLEERRNVVLRRMLDSRFILDEEYAAAVRRPMDMGGIQTGIEDVDYYLEVALNQMNSELRRRLELSALTVFLPIDPFLQKTATRAIHNQLKTLQVRINRKRAKGEIFLEGALVVMDVKRCLVLASQGGRSFRLSPFNRVLQGRRQAGSLAKPFVFLAELISNTASGPESKLLDEAFEWEYDRKSWSPKNYDKKFRGEVSFREVLEQSLNVPTARLAQSVGIPQIVAVMRQAGIVSDLYPVPALSLGGFEVTPFEMAVAYLTLAREGEFCRPDALLSVFDENGNQLFKREPESKNALPGDPTRKLVEMLSGVMTRGTARLAQSRLKNEAGYFVGKTGTTSDYRDAWFIGFSPDLLALVWVGYDETELVGLTGASAALPIWLDFIEASRSHYLPKRFPWIEGQESP